MELNQCHFCGKDKDLIKINGQFYCNQRCQTDETELNPYKRKSAQTSLDKALKPYIKDGRLKL